MGRGRLPGEAQNRTVEAVDVGTEIISLPAPFAERPEGQICPDFQPKNSDQTAAAKAAVFSPLKERRTPAGKSHFCQATEGLQTFRVLSKHLRLSIAWSAGRTRCRKARLRGRRMVAWPRVRTSIEDSCKTQRAASK